MLHYIFQKTPVNAAIFEHITPRIYDNHGNGVDSNWKTERTGTRFSLRVGQSYYNSLEDSVDLLGGVIRDIEFFTIRSDIAHIREVSSFESRLIETFSRYMTWSYL